MSNLDINNDLDETFGEPTKEITLSEIEPDQQTNNTEVMDVSIYTGGKKSKLQKLAKFTNFGKLINFKENLSKS